RPPGEPWSAKPAAMMRPAASIARHCAWSSLMPPRLKPTVTRPVRLNAVSREPSVLSCRIAKSIPLDAVLAEPATTMRPFGRNATARAVGIVAAQVESDDALAAAIAEAGGVEGAVAVETRDREVPVAAQVRCARADDDDLAVGLHGEAGADVVAAVEIDRGTSVEAETRVELAIGGEAGDVEIARLDARG